jgi:hypothetical protein
MDGGGTPRPRGAAFPIFGEAQTQRIAGAAGSVRVRCFVDSRGRRDWKLRYFSNIPSLNESGCKGMADFERASRYFLNVLDLTSPAPTRATLPCNRDENLAWKKGFSSLRVRALFGLGWLSQEGRTPGETVNMKRAVHFLKEALAAANDRRALACIDQSIDGGIPPLGARTSTCSTIPLFSLALSFHFGRGCAQDLNRASRLYREFLWRGDERRNAEHLPTDVFAANAQWRRLTLKLSAHCRALLREQQGAIIRASVALGGC